MIFASVSDPYFFHAGIRNNTDFCQLRRMPADWDEREKIADPEATKPDDWDEDAPRQIIDQGWK